MRLRLTVPAEWTVHRLGDQEIATLVPGEQGWLLALAWGDLVPFPDDPNAWVRRAMWVDVVGDASVTPGESETRATKSGWSLRLLDAEVLHADGTVAEHRLGAFYKFLEYGAVALVRAKRRDLLDAHRARILETLESGMPQWQAGGLPVCLHDLFAPLP